MLLQFAMEEIRGKWYVKKCYNSSNYTIVNSTKRLDLKASI